MQKIKEFLEVPQNRKYVYNVIRALVVLLVAAGFIVPGLSEVIMVLVASVLGFVGNELASHNLTPTEDLEDPDLLGL